MFMKKCLTTLLVCLSTGILIAGQPFKGSYYDPENKISFHIDLYEETVNVPGMEMFGPMHGYMSGTNGSVYGVWMITTSKVENEDKEATIRLSNDLGSETQEARLALLNDSIMTFEQQGSIVIKKVVNRKLVKIPRKLIFKKIQ